MLMRGEGGIQVLEYIDAYIEQYNLRPLATLGCEVEKMAEAPGGGFLVSTLLLATGNPLSLSSLLLDTQYSMFVPRSA